MTTALLEVIALDAADARLAVEGGADRLELVSGMEFSGFNPAVETFAQIRAAVDVPLRVMLRLRDGFAAGGAAGVTALKTAARELRAEGADEFVIGLLDRSGAPDVPALEDVLAMLDGSAWTFHKAIDAAADRDAVFDAIRPLPGLDTVLTSGGPFPSGQGVEVLRAEAAREAARADGVGILVGGGLKLLDLPALRAAGLTRFHVGSAVRATGDWAGPVDPERVAAWRSALDETAEAVA
jgi:copper homeostasis protein